MIRFLRQSSLDLFIVGILAGLLFFVGGSKIATAQTPPPPPFSVLPPSPIIGPDGVTVTGHPGRICTAYMLDADNIPGDGRQNYWFVKADASGSLTVTLVAGLDYEKDTQPFGSPNGPYTSADFVEAKIYDPNGSQVGDIFLQMPLVSPPANIDSKTIGTEPGAIYRVTVYGRPGALMPPLYRLKFDGAAEVGYMRDVSDASSPRSVAGLDSAANGSRWIMNVAVGEGLDFSVRPSPPPYPPQAQPIYDTWVQVYDPNHQKYGQLVQVDQALGTYFSIPASDAGALPGPWVVVVVQPRTNGQSSPYKIAKNGGSDPGTYTTWYSNGTGTMALRVNSPSGLTSVALQYSVDFPELFWASYIPTSIPTNTTIPVEWSFVNQNHARIIPPPGYAAFPSTLAIPAMCDTETDVTAEIKDLVKSSVTRLWPPNHKMVPVTISVGDPNIICTIVSVTSNEPIDGLGDGDQSPDWIITGPQTVDLRAERSGTGTGRIYTITIKCTDAAGNSALHTVTVSVPHDLGK